ncbi:hypothetical protein SAMN03159444_01611 [Pseudomonas sp. NFACC02]|nr:hypothetical protein SAMN03159444_01611 [Pseudomonas sp. NFACC02]
MPLMDSMPVGAGLLAKAVCQSTHMCLIDSIRQQAGSHSRPRHDRF